MSGHSKWSTIKRKKAITDGARGKVFTRHARLIEIAARDGGSGDIATNAQLASAVASAKSDNVPNDNIDRAIKKGIGAGSGEAMAARVYEAYAPGGVALIITALTDNVTRTISNVRHAVTKYGGKMAESGSVAFQFERCGIVSATRGELSEDDAEMAAIDAGATDIDADDEQLTVYVAASDLASARKKLTDAGINVSSAELGYRPVATVEVGDIETARAITTLIEHIEEDDDVDTVYANFVFSEEVAAVMTVE